MKKFLPLSFLLFIILLGKSAVAQPSEKAIKKGTSQAAVLILQALKHARDLDGSFYRVTGPLINSENGKDNFRVINFPNFFGEEQLIQRLPNKSYQFTTFISKDHIPFYKLAVLEFLPKTVQLGKFTSQLYSHDLVSEYKILQNNVEIGILRVDGATQTGLLSIYRPM